MPLSRRRDDCDDANISCSVRYEHQFALPMDDSFVWAQKRGNNLLGTPLLPYLASLILETRLEHRTKFVLWMRMAIRLFILLLSFEIEVKKRSPTARKKGESLLKARNRSSATTMSVFFVRVFVCADIRTNPSILWPSSSPNCFKVTSRGFINRIIYWPASKCRVRRRRYFRTRGIIRDSFRGDRTRLKKKVLVFVLTLFRTGYWKIQ